MRKVFYTGAALILLSVTAFGQGIRKQQDITNIPLVPFSEELQLDQELPVKLSDERTISGMDYDFFSAFEQLEPNDWTLTAFRLFPEEINNVFLTEAGSEKDTVQLNTWVSVGALFDPREEAYGLPPSLNADFSSQERVLSRWNNYKVDSIVLFHQYVRKVDTFFDTTSQTWVKVEDKIRVKLFRTNGIVATYGNPFPPEFPYGMVKYNRNRGEAGNAQNPASETFLITLDDNDTATGGTVRTRTIDVSDRNFIVQGGDLPRNFMAITVNYVPGQPYSNDDTLFVPQVIIDDGITPEPKKKLNIYNYVVARDLKNWEDRQPRAPFRQPRSFSNGMALPITERREENFWANGSDATKSCYIPGNVYFSPLYPRFAFYITSTGVGIEDGDYVDGYALGQAYPNPAAQNTEVSVDFVLASREQVQISLMNITGQVVKTITNESYAAGDQRVTFSTEGLKPGMYIYTMNAGGFSKTRKLHIAK